MVVRAARRPGVRRNRIIIPRNTIAYDGYNRANSATTLGSTEVGGLAYTSVVGPWGVRNGRAYNPGGNGGMVYVDAAVTDATFTAIAGDTVAPYNLNDNCGLMARYTDSTHFYLVQVSSTAIQIYKCNGGFTLLAQTTTTITPGITVMGIKVNGTTIQSLKNGTVVDSVTDSSLTTGTKYGYRFGNSSDQYNFDDLLIVP
jgi:hypothetical protein